MARIDRRRERLLRELTGSRLARVGIFGGSVCQVCGELGTFRHLVGAMAAYRHGFFVALRHQHDESVIEAARGAGEQRYCEICRRRDALAALESFGNRAWAHPRCSADVETYAIQRRRYADLALPDTEALVRFVDALDRMRIDMAHGAPGGWALPRRRVRAGLRFRSWLRRRRGVLVRVRD